MYREENKNEWINKMEIRIMQMCVGAQKDIRNVFYIGMLQCSWEPMHEHTLERMFGILQWYVAVKLNANAGARTGEDIKQFAIDLLRYS